MPRARAVEPVAEESQEEKRKRALRKAYGTATQRLRDKHRGDFEGFYAQEAAALGVEWRPRPSQEQQAAEQFDALVEQFPWLADRLRADAEPEDPDAEHPEG